MVFDNLVKTLDSPELCKAITERSHSDRRMKTQEAIKVPVECTWMATGNNIKLGGDMARRCYWIRMDAGVTHPHLRQGFRHSDLKGWVCEFRGEIICAILTLCRAWYAAGRPRPSVRPVGSFEKWTENLVGGVLQHAGVKGFLANSSDMYARADPEAAQWEGFLSLLDELFYSAPFTARDIVVKLGEQTAATRELSEVLPDSVVKATDKNQPDIGARCLGNAFREIEGRRFGDQQWHVRRVGVSRKPFSGKYSIQ